MRRLPALLIATTLTFSIMGGTAQAGNPTYETSNSTSQSAAKKAISINLNDVKTQLKDKGIVIISGKYCPPNNKPGTPDKPNKPGTPDKPNKPGTPDKPNKPGTPDKPNKPGTPDKPNKPGTPDKPNKPETPDKPETDVSYANQVVNLVNKEREKAGLKPLTVKTDITAAADMRAKEIKTSFSHTRPDGRGFSTALTEKGVSFRGAGENIAYGQKTPEEVMKGWMNSTGHRENILKKDFTSIGVGYYKDASGTAYWTQLFTN